LLITAIDNNNHTLYGAITLTVLFHAAPVLVSRNKSVTVSSVQDASLPGSAAVDGQMGTRWGSGSGDPQWIYVDLGSEMPVNQVILKWEQAYASGYKIQVSTDANTWTDVFSTTTGNGGTDSIVIAPTNARYVRMYGTVRGSQYAYSLYEFEIYSPPGGLTQNSLKPAAFSFVKPMLSVSSYKISITVPEASTKWTCTLFSLNGAMLASYTGRGNRDISFVNIKKGFTMATLKTENSVIAERIVIK
jgi:hypothetical protein